MPSRELDVAFQDLLPEFRELLREMPRNSPRAPKMAESLQEHVFPVVGMVPRLVIRGSLQVHRFHYSNLEEQTF